MSRSKKSPLLQLLDRIDRNTRGVAKIASAIEYLKDGGESYEVLEPVMFALVQERRNMRAEVEDGLKQQRSSGGSK